MVKEYEFEMPNGSLYYEISEEGVVITRFSGLAGELEIPDTLAGCPVVGIERKAFLSKKNLRKIVVPATVSKVGDWAFAYCDNLKEIRFGNTSIVFEKAVFLECNKLEYLYIGPVTEEAEASSVAALLAAAVTTAGATYLLDTDEIGSTEWLEKWDARMLAILHAPDDEGYSKQVLCGEEDYGSTDMVAYKSEQRKKKVRLLMLRCLHDFGLKEVHREELIAYLQAHTKSDRKPADKSAAEDETWQVVLKEHGNDKIYYELFAELGCITDDNFDALLSDVSEHYPELRAFLMRHKSENMNQNDFFAGLDL